MTIPKILMYLCIMYSKELIKGTLKTVILQLLSDNGRMYGYEITRRVKELSEGELKLTEGALYPTLHKLENEGLLSTEKVQVGGRVRKYYRLTPVGRTDAFRKTNEFRSFTEMMNKVLNIKPKLT